MIRRRVAPLAVSFSLLPLVAGCGGDEASNASASAAETVASTDGPPAGDPEDGSPAEADPPAAAPGEPSDAVTKKDVAMSDPAAPPAPIETPEPAGRPEANSVTEYDAIFRQISKDYEMSSIPRFLQPPFDQKSVREFVQAAKFLEARRQADVAWLEAFDPKAVPGAEPYDVRSLENDRKKYLSLVKDDFPGDFAKTIVRSRDALESGVRTNTRIITLAAEADMSDRSEVATLFGNGSLVRQREQAIDNVLAALDGLSLVDRELSELIEGGGEDWSEKRAAIAASITAARANLAKAGDAVKPPKDIGDAGLTETAETVLKANDAVGEWTLLAVVSRPRRESRVEWIITGSTGDARLERVERKWEEFQVSTVEPDADGPTGYAIWVNNLAKYSEGPDTTPIGEWVVRERFRSAPIAKSNLPGEGGGAN
ncbi:MAG: hypothetical protein AAF907_03535 [Planctomycetota bacterium]